MSNRNIRREKAKEIHNKVKKMSPGELMKFLDAIVINHSNNTVDEIMEILHEHHGFGKKRQEGIINKLQEKQKL